MDRLVVIGEDEGPAKVTITFTCIMGFAKFTITLYMYNMYNVFGLGYIIQLRVYVLCIWLNLHVHV